MSYASRAGRAYANARNPRAFAVCDRCGIWINHHKLSFQWDWAGAGMINKQILVCPRCLDKPQEQLRAIVLPADPLPIANPRIEPFVADQSTQRVTGSTVRTYGNTGIPIGPVGDYRITQNNRRRVPQQTGEPPGGLNQLPGTQPNLPAGQVPGLPYGNDEIPDTGAL
jgi:hypothetical protein